VRVAGKGSDMNSRPASLGEGTDADWILERREGKGLKKHLPDSTARKGGKGEEGKSDKEGVRKFRRPCKDSLLLSWQGKRSEDYIV